MNKLILCTILSLSFIFGNARETAKEAILKNNKKAASNMYSYPEPDVQYTAAPTGYKPIYLSMYARHGSRHLMVSEEYTKPLDVLRKAYSNSCITTLAKRTMVVVDSLERLAHGRFGELTTRGAKEHQGVAARIYQHFPELFTNNVHLEARSTPLQRTMMSMFNQCMTLQSCCPKMTSHCDASQHDVWYMDFQDVTAFKYRKTPAAVKAIKEYNKKTLNPNRFINAMFTNKKFIDENVNKEEFMLQMFKLANMVQDVGANLDIYDIFTKEELVNLWKRDNFKWYTEYSFNSLTEYNAPFTQIHLLRNFINVADTCLASKNNNLTLRFGHEVDVLPFACLLKLHDTVYDGTDGDEVAENWRNYEIYPMASNVQFVFYRKTGSPDLVKIMLNEREQTIPVESNIAPYYKWSDVRAYLLDLLSKAPKN